MCGTQLTQTEVNLYFGACVMCYQRQVFENRIKNADLRESIEARFDRLDKRFGCTVADDERECR
jgi:hypothetical protein